MIQIMFIGGSDIVSRISFEKISLQFWRFNYCKPPLFERGGGLRKRSVGTKTEKLLRLYQNKNDKADSFNVLVRKYHRFESQCLFYNNKAMV